MKFSFAPDSSKKVKIGKFSDLKMGDAFTTTLPNHYAVWIVTSDPELYPIEPIRAICFNRISGMIIGIDKFYQDEDETIEIYDCEIKID